jgi:enediyne biosynthesis protein E4
LSGWGLKFFDFDNDGWKDIFVAQGHVLDNVEKTSSGLRYEQPPLLLHNAKGRFQNVDAGSALEVPRAGRGAAFGDIDNDGDIDVVVANVGEGCSVFRNNGGNRNHWLGLRLTGSRSNRDGIGARIEITSASGQKQFYTVSTAGSYISASDRRVIAGLGADTFAKRVVIKWPSGVIQNLSNVKADRMMDVREPAR